MNEWGMNDSLSGNGTQLTGLPTALATAVPGAPARSPPGHSCGEGAGALSPRRVMVGGFISIPSGICLQLFSFFPNKKDINMERPWEKLLAWNPEKPQRRLSLPWPGGQMESPRAA